MDAIKKMKAIRLDKLRAHPAFPIVLTAWLVALLGLAAWVVQGSALYGLMGAIAGGLLGRYLVQRLSKQADAAEAEAAPEIEREKRIRRVLGPDEDAPENNAEDNSFEQDAPLLAVKPQVPTHDLFDNEALLGDDFDADDNVEEAIESSDTSPADRPQFLSLDELELGEEHSTIEAEVAVEAPCPGPAPSVAVDEGYVDPGAALSAFRNGGQRAPISWGEETTSDAPESAYEAEFSQQPVYDTATSLNTSNHEVDKNPVPADASVMAEPQIELVPPVLASEVHNPTPEPGEHAAAKLRSQDLSQMSMVQMIERLAFALDDYREVREQVAADGASDQADLAVADALRNLPALTRAADVYATHGNAALAVSTREQAEATEVALRDALEKLQRLSGSA